MLRDDRGSREIGDIRSRNLGADQKAIVQALTFRAPVRWAHIPPILHLWQSLQ